MGIGINLKKLGIVLLALGAVLLGLFLYQHYRAQLDSEFATLLTRLEPLEAAPSFRLEDMDGNKKALSDYQGQPVIVNFWATWCPPCREELPAMNRAWEKVKDDGIAMLAVNVGEDEDTIFAFTGEYPIDFTVLLDESGEVAQQWPIKGLPTTFVLDKEGRLVYRAIGGREWDDDQILDAVRALK